MDLHFYAWGNAYFNIPSCAEDEYSKTAMYCWIDACGEKGNETTNCWNETLKMCQHGEEECVANIVEACAGAHANSQKDFVQFLYCFEKNEGDLSSARTCAENANIDAKAVETCAKGEEGLALDMKNAEATANFGSSRLGTPWIVVNGQHVDDPSKLLQAICDAYEGASKPSGCQ